MSMNPAQERGPVTGGLLAAMMSGGRRPQLALDLPLEEGATAMETRWRDVAESERNPAPVLPGTP